MPPTRRRALIRVPRDKPIAVVASSHAFDPARLDAGLDLVRAAGWDCELFPDLLQPHRYFAAPDLWRRDQLAAALTDPRFGAVWPVRGGSGMTRLIDDLPWDRVRPVPVLGFSDVTPLLHAMYTRARTRALHAPVLHSLTSTAAEDHDALFAVMDGAPPPPMRGEVWVDGIASGPLVGGNLTLIAATCGTRWQLRARDRILFLEDIGEQPFRIDRMLQQCKQAGVLRGVRAVLLGGFDGCNPPAGASWTLDDVLREHLLPLGVPIVARLPFGHGVRNAPMIVGAPIRIRGEHVTA